MREEEPNWFSKWDEELPSPEELTPLSQTLITPDLALAFDIPPNPNPNPNSPTATTTPPHHHPPPPPIPQSSDFGSPELTSGAGAGTPSGGADEPARTLKRPRLVWTPQLHKRFVDAVAHLGIKNAVPKTIMQLMSVDGLTRENVASHLQKYRLYLKRMQGLSAGGGGAGGAGAGAAGVDAATDHLFGSTPVPHHFLHPGRPASDHFLYAPVAAALHHHHHQQQMAAAAVAAAAQQQQYQQQQRQVGQFGSPPAGQFEHPLLSRQQAQPVHHRMAAPSGHQPQAAAYVEDLESATGGGGGGGGGGGRKVLTLFPTGDD